MVMRSTPKTNRSYILVYKVVFDFSLSFFLLAIFILPMLFIWVVCSIQTRSNGLFLQKRIGSYGRPFYIFKFKTMIDDQSNRSHISLSSDPRITPFGHLLRRLKLDELPQLVNILFGQMSFVGPRPDVSGYADQLSVQKHPWLMLKPGITGWASLYFSNEEYLLSCQDDPQSYNDQIIWPQKILINDCYFLNCSFFFDLLLMVLTLFPRSFRQALVFSPSLTRFPGFALIKNFF